jgi:hypothetical protein
MLFIPGFVVSLVSFPGVISHEYAHKLACEWRNVRIQDVVYFQLGNPAGYVRHRTPRRQSDAFWITTAPFFINSLLALNLGLLVGTLSPTLIPESHILLAVSYVLLWVAVSIGMHSFPSRGDATTLWALTKENWNSSFGGFLSVPLVLLMYVSHYLSYAWLDVAYGAALVYLGLVLANYSLLPV